MGEFKVNKSWLDIYYDREKRPSLFLDGKKIMDVSFFLQKDIEESLEEVVNMNTFSKQDYEAKIKMLDALKEEAFKELVKIKRRYKELYYEDKKRESLGDDKTDNEELINTRKLKNSFVAYLKFLDKGIRLEHKNLNRLVRKANRINNTDMKTSIILDDKSKYIYDMMLEKEDFYEEDNHVYLVALSYYVKNLDFSKIDDDRFTLCLDYVDEIIARLKESSHVYLENFGDIHLLKQVAKQKMFIIGKNDECKRSFLNKIIKKIDSLEASNIVFNSNLDEICDDMELVNSFYRLVHYEKNINLVKKFLEDRPDLVYVESPSKSTQYYLSEIIDDYGNLLLNARENHSDLEYYRSLVRAYIDAILVLDNQNMKLFMLKKIQSVIKKVTNSDFSFDRKEACFYALEECVNKINGVDNDKVLNFHDSRIRSYHQENDAIVFTIDDDNAKVFEQAYSYYEDDGYKYLSIYIPDTTEIKNGKIPVIDDLMMKKSKDTNILDSRTSRSLNLKSGKKSDVLGYHFVLDDNNKVLDLILKKEKIVVLENLKASDIDNKVNNFLFEIINKMCDTLNTLEIPFTNVSEEKLGLYTISRLSLFFQSELAKYCDEHDIPYISRFVYTKEEVKVGLIKDIEDSLDTYNLSVGQIVESIEKAYQLGIYTIDNKENLGVSRRAKVTAPFRDLASYINQIIIYHYYANGNTISYRDDLKNRRDLRKITDAMNKRLIEKQLDDAHQEELILKREIKRNNQKIKYKFKRASNK